MHDNIVEGRILGPFASPAEAKAALGQWLAEDDQYGDCPDLLLAEAPTVHRPGSPEKIAAMTARAVDGRAIFHPQDCPGPAYRRPPIAAKGKGKPPPLPLRPRGWLPLRKPDGRLRGVHVNGWGWRAQPFDKDRGRVVYLGRYATREEAEAAVLDYWRSVGRQVS